MNFLIIILALFFISFLLVFYIVLSNFFLPKTVLENQLDFLRNSWEKYYGRSFARPKVGFGPKAIGGLLATVESLADILGLRKTIEARLHQSGIKIDFPRFITYHSIATIVAGLAAYIFFGFIGALVLIGATAFLPIVYINYKGKKIQDRLGEQLPELLTIVAGLLNAGHGFFQALDSAVRELSPPITYEFKKVLTDARLGIDLEDALDGLAKRVQNRDYDWLIVAIKIQRQTGGNLSEILEMLATTIKEREQLIRQMKTLTAEGRYSAYILVATPVVIGLLLYFLSPGYIGLLFATKAGLFMLALALVLMLIGSFWLKKIVEIEV